MIFGSEGTSDISKNGFEVLLNKFESQEEEEIELENQINTIKKVDLHQDIRIQVEFELLFELVGASLQTVGQGQSVIPRVSN
jgi:hypothetical protein